MIPKSSSLIQKFQKMEGERWEKKKTNEKFLFIGPVVQQIPSFWILPLLSLNEVPPNYISNSYHQNYALGFFLILKGFFGGGIEQKPENRLVVSQLSEQFNQSLLQRIFSAYIGSWDTENILWFLILGTLHGNYL